MANRPGKDVDGFAAYLNDAPLTTTGTVDLPPIHKRRMSQPGTTDADQPSVRIVAERGRKCAASRWMHQPSLKHLICIVSISSGKNAAALCRWLQDGL